MRYRTVICVLLVVVVGVGCSLFGQTDSEDADPPRSTSAAIPSTANSAPIGYNGPTSIEERIASSDAIVRARLTNVTTEVVTTTAEKWNEHYYVAVKFQLSVSEYLYGSGANSIIAYWVSYSRFKTVQEAEAYAPTLASRRDSQWDNRDAVLFLGDGGDWEFGTLAKAQDVYFLAASGPIQGENFYSLTSRYDRRWLPAVSASLATPSDSKEFLLEEPAAGGSPSTITLGILKAKIAAIVAEINAGDGSETYKECIVTKYAIERQEGVRMSGSGPSAQYRSFEPRWDGTFESGQPAGAELYKYEFRGISEIVDGTEEKTKLWLDGEDAALFSVREINHRPFRNKTQFEFSVVSVRPIAAGTYEFNHNYGTHIDCGNTSIFALTANVTAPDNVLHELFFDPVNQSGAVKADDTNGVLKPAGFMDTNGASAMIESIEWQAGTVKLKVSPHNGLANHILDIIELDGTVSLSLDVADATVDAANDTLSWSVDSQPWEDGDMLMVRIRRAR